MSITSISSRWLNRVYKTLAILLVLVAVLISAFRLLLPYVDNHHQTLQNYINNTYHTDLSIGALSLTWQTSGPVLVASQVRLLDTDNMQVFIDHLEIKVDFWRSLFNQALVTDDLVLRGALVEFDRSLLISDPNLVVEPVDDIPQRSDVTNRSATVKHDDEEDVDLVADVFLRQINRFSVLDSQVVINNGDKKRLFLISKLNWLNKGSRHQAQGGVIIDGISSNNLKVLLDFKGNDFTDMTGQLYLQANHLDITPWLDRVLAIDNDKTSSNLNFSAWLNLHQGKFKALQVILDENKINWLYQQQPQQLSLGAGQLLLTQNLSVKKLPTSSSQASYSTLKGSDKALTFSTTPLDLQFNDHEKQKFIIQASQKGQDYFAYLSSLDLSLIGQLAPLLSTNIDKRDMLEDIAIVGNVTDIFLQKKSGNQQAMANFSGISTHFSQGIPGIEHASGSVGFFENQLNISLSAHSGALDFAHHFIKPIPYNAINAEFVIDFSQQGWQLAAENIAFVSDELTLNADIALSQTTVLKDGVAKGNSSKESSELNSDSSNGEIVMSLLATAKNADVNIVNHYYPLTSMSSSLISYLNKALVSGELSQAVVLFNGPLARFPFEDHSGIFVVDAELTKSTFLFDEDWPAIENFSANLNFTNNSMLITGRSGSLTGLDVTGVSAGISSLSGDQILLVDTLIKPTPAENITQLMDESPLKNSVGSVLEQLKVSGDIRGEFHLNLPLNATDEVVAKGVIQFDNNHLALQQPQMDFSQVNGQLFFENDKITTKNLSLHWLDLPLSIDVNGVDQSDYYKTTLGIHGRWQDKNWHQQITPLLTKYIEGELNWQGNVNLYQHHNSGFSYDANISSTLAQAVFNLPIPYKKAQGEQAPLAVTVQGDLFQSTINATLGKEMSFFGVLNHEKNSFLRSHLVLGDEKMLLPMDGFHITTKLEYADFSQWQPFISDIITSVSSYDGIKSTGVESANVEGASAANHNTENINNNNTLATSTAMNTQTSLFVKPERIRGTLGKLDVLGQRLNNVSFNLLDKNHWWLLQLNAKEIRSQMKFYPDWFEQGIDVDADFIYLSTNNDESEKAKSENSVVASVTENVVTHSGISLPLTLTKSNVSATNKKYQAEIFNSIPRLNLHCDRCLVDRLDLGTIDLTIDRSEQDVLKLTSFKAKRAQASLNLTGQWLFNDEHSITSLTGKFTIKDIEDELAAFDYASIIKDSGGVANFNLTWQGGPQDFTMAQLSGDISAKTDDGYLADVSDKAKIFSVLSLQSLVRKLTLDFRDIFSDGMFYSTIKGDYHIDKGVLYTNNTKMNGTAGDLLIKGNTNLATGELDLKMSYKPNLTSSLPVLAWIATLNPVTFLAGVAIDQVFTSKVVSEFNFELTGNVDKPNFREVNRKTKDISVGRSTPPQIVESKNSNSDNKTQNNAQETEQPQTKEKAKTEPKQGDIFIRQPSNGGVNG